MRNKIIRVFYDGYNLLYKWLHFKKEVDREIYEKLEEDEIQPEDYEKGKTLEDKREELIEKIRNKSFDKKIVPWIVFSCSRSSRREKKTRRMERGKVKLVFTEGESSASFIERMSKSHDKVITLNQNLRNDLEDEGIETPFVRDYFPNRIKQKER